MLLKYHSPLGFHGFNMSNFQVPCVLTTCRTCQLRSTQCHVLTPTARHHARASLHRCTPCALSIPFPLPLTISGHVSVTGCSRLTQSAVVLEVQVCHHSGCIVLPLGGTKVAKRMSGMGMSLGRESRKLSLDGNLAIQHCFKPPFSTTP